MINKKDGSVLTKHIGGIGLYFFFNQAAFKSGGENRDDEFALNTQAEIKLWVHIDDFPKIRSKEKVFDSKSNWSLYRNKKKYFLYNGSLELDPFPSKLVILESDLKYGEIFIRDSESSQDIFSDPLEYPLNQILMIILLSRAKGTLLHACGVDDGNSGYLFLGNSGHGKSTIAKIWFENKSTVLNDDRIIVREKDGVIWMYGTPWHGDFRELSLKGMPISKIFFLRKGKRNSAVRKEDSEAVSMLLARGFFPFWDKEGMGNTVNLCHAVVSDIPCYELTFVPDSEIIEFVRNI